MDLSAYGTQELDSFQEGKSRGKGRRKDKGMDNLPTTPYPICGKAGHWKKDCWYNMPSGWDETHEPKDNSKGEDGKDKTSTITPAAVEQRQEECEVLALQRSRTLLQRSSEEEAELGCGKSGASIILLCDWRDDVEWFLLECLGIDSGAARSVVPADEIPGSPVERTAKLVVCTRLPPESACSIRRNSISWELWTAKCEA